MTNNKNICEGDKCTFQILFTSDVHGAFRNFSYSAMSESNTMGINKIATLMKQDKADFDGETFIVDIGDAIQGNATGLLLKDESGEFQPFPLLAAYDAIGYDLFSIGNHEFNYGVDTMQSAFKGSKIERLCANVFKVGHDNTNKEVLSLLDGCKPYVIKTLENGLRIAFIGVVSPNIINWDKHIIENSGYTAKSAATITEQIMEEICDKADVYVLMGHMDTDNELGTAGSGANDVIEKNDNLTVFLGAHFHKIKGKREEQYILKNKVKFAENLDLAGSYGKVLITATFIEGKWRVVNRQGTYEESDVKTDIISLADLKHVENDEDIDRLTQPAHDFLTEQMKIRIGELVNGPLVLPPEIEGTHRIVLEATPYVEFMGEIMTHYAKSDFAAVAINHYNINCQNGDIYRNEIYKICVYESTLLKKVRLSGAQIKQWLEWSYQFFGKKEDPKGPAVNPDTDTRIPYGEIKKCYLFDQFWGLDYDVDLTKPAQQRIHINKLLDGRQFDMNALYTVATSSYRVTTNLPDKSSQGILDGADFELLEIKNKDGDIEEKSFIELVEDWITNKNHGKITCPKGGNWRFVNLNWAEE